MQHIPVEPEHIRRYNDMPWWGQLLIRHESIRTIWLPISPAIFGLAIGMPLAISLVMSIAYVAAGIRFVRPKKKTDKPGEDDEEPQFALLEVLSLRLPIVFDEGFCLIIPGLSRLILRSKEQWNKEFIVKSVGCRLDPMNVAGRKKNLTFFEAVSRAFKKETPDDIQIGGKVTVTVGATIAIDYQDPWVILEYDEVGERPGVEAILADQIDQDVREMGRLLTWLQMKFATDLMSAHIIANLAKPTDEINKTKLFDSPTQESIQQFLLLARVNGVSYLQGLGVKIKRMQITAVVGEGKLEEEAEKASIEMLRNQGLIRNTEGLIKAVGMMKESLNDGSLSHKNALEAVQINDPDAKIKRDIQDINFNADGIEAAISRMVRLGLHAFTRKDKTK